jgi:phage shock protein A
MQAAPSQSQAMPDLNHLRTEIERMRTQVHRQRGEIRQLQRAGISTASAEELLERMLNKIDELCVGRDRLKQYLPSHQAYPPLSK